MLIPYATNAPIYYFPYTTIGLIVANVLVFALTGPADDETMANVLRFHLQFDRIAPWQWVTTNFLHGDVIHLIGNMIFLWSFGLVVEGKLGWWRFLTIYLLIATLYGAMVQLAMFVLSDHEGSALGASAAIYGMLGLAVAWAPQNDMHCLAWYYRPRLFDISVQLLALIYFGFTLLGLALNGFSMSSDLLHFTGLAIGLPLGLFMVRQHWVDCEGYDLISVFRGETGRPKIVAADVLRAAQQTTQDARGRQRTMAQQAMESALQQENAAAAAAIYTKHAELFTDDHVLPDATLVRIVQGLHAAKSWETSIPCMQQLLRQSKQPLITVRLKLAQIMLQICKRPRKAWDVLQELPAELPPAAAQTREKLVRAIEMALQSDDDDLQLADD